MAFTFRPNSSTAKSVDAPASTIWLYGFFPIIHAGNIRVHDSDFPCLGGIEMQIRLSSPRAAFSSTSASSMCCGPTSKRDFSTSSGSSGSGIMSRIKSKKPFRALMMFMSRFAALICCGSCGKSSFAPGPGGFCFGRDTGTGEGGLSFLMPLFASSSAFKTSNAARFPGSAFFLSRSRSFLRL